MRSSCVGSSCTSQYNTEGSEMTMSSPPEKVYVAVGNDLQDGLGTLEWALKNWASHSISIVIVHINNASMDFVHTPIGKLPASAVSDAKLEIARMCEQETIDKLLAKYMSACGKVRAETLKIERSEEPIHKVIIELISRLHVTKLVMGMTVMKSKSSSGKGRTAISELFNVHKHKPSFCELYIICGGKLVFLRDQENDEGYVEDDQGVAIAKMRERGNFKWFLGKIFTDSPVHLVPSDSNSPRTSSSSKTESPGSRDWWESHAEEIEKYFQCLSTSNLDENSSEEEDSSFASSSIEKMKLEGDSSMSDSEKTEAFKAKIDEARKTIGLKRTEAKADKERQSRAEWAISLCNRRAEELELRINQEIVLRIDRKKELESTKEDIYEVKSDIEESRSRLNAIQELKSELANKLQISSLAKNHSETQLENAVNSRAKMLEEIELQRQHRDILRRRIDFCKEKDAIVAANTSNRHNYGYREFTAEEIRLATDNFAEHLSLKSGGFWTNVYRGILNHTTVTIKLPNSLNEYSEEEFQAQMHLLTSIRHPHLISTIGICPEQRSFVFEYMPSGSLQEILLSSDRSSRRRTQNLHWNARIRIAAEVCSALGFLHSPKSGPIIHGDLKPSSVLLDSNLVAKIICFQITKRNDQAELGSDVSSLGMLMLQLLTGRSGAGLVEEVATAMAGGAVGGAVDEMAGQWPLDLAEEFAGIALRCARVSEQPIPELRAATVTRELDNMKKKAAEVAASETRATAAEERPHRDENCCDVPSAFVCPILQEVMRNPHIAADGSSYELKAIEEWLGTGHETSPMTNLKLKHKHLTPNHTLRLLINEWLNKNSNSPS